MTDAECVAALKLFSTPAIDERIGVLRTRIKDAQYQIVALTVVRKGIQKSEEMRAISERKATEAIDEALREAQLGSEPLKVLVNSEGSIRN